MAKRYITVYIDPRGLEHSGGLYSEVKEVTYAKYLSLNLEKADAKFEVELVGPPVDEVVVAVWVESN